MRPEVGQGQLCDVRRQRNHLLAVANFVTFGGEEDCHERIRLDSASYGRSRWRSSRR